MLCKENSVKKKLIQSTSVMHFLSLGALVLLPGCSDWFNEKSNEAPQQQENGTQNNVQEKELENAAIEVLTQGVSVIDKDELTGEVLVTMNGKPVVTVDSLEIEKEKLFEANPQIKQMMAFMDPAQLDKSLVEGLTNQAIIDQYISDQGIDKTAEYQKELKEGFKAVERMVNTKIFTQNFNVKVTDAEVRTFYNENKDLMPDLALSRGGVKATGIQFDNEADARAFAAEITAGKTLQQAAEAQGKSDSIRDFMTVNEQSTGLDASLKAKILGMSQVPSVEVVALNDKTVWVVHASGKEETQYRPFEQVKAGLKDYLEKESRAKMFDTEMEKLKKRYNVELKAQFLTEPEAEMDIDVDALMQSAEADFDDAAETLAFYEQQMSESV